MEYIKIIGIVFGATGFWRLVEYLVKHKSERKYLIAQARNQLAQANSQIVADLILYNTQLKERIQELEAVVEELREELKKLNHDQ